MQCAALQKQLKGWAEQPTTLHRKYHWYNLQQLKTRIKEIDPRSKINGNKAALLDILVNCELKQKQRDEAIECGKVRSIG